MQCAAGVTDDGSEWEIWMRSSYSSYIQLRAHTLGRSESKRDRITQAWYIHSYQHTLVQRSRVMAHSSQLSGEDLHPSKHLCSLRRMMATKVVSECFSQCKMRVFWLVKNWWTGEYSANTKHIRCIKSANDVSWK